MDIKQLSSLVRSLVLDSDEVVVPGLGTFRAEVVPASFSDKGYTVNPPYRKLNFVAEELPEAKRIEADGLKECVEALKKELKENRAVEFPGLGKLRLTKGDQLFFVADEDANIFPEGFGLESVSLKNKEGGEKHEKKSSPKKAEKSKKVKAKKPLTDDQKGMIAIGIIVGIIILIMILLRLFGTLTPDFIDKLLYSPEELARLHGNL
ncbi:MAG: hypothetical protein J6037_02690 [Bacteroidales bacterium]|nr:hypothetical protein [Bacteroidales bacterium]